MTPSIVFPAAAFLVLASQAVDVGYTMGWHRRRWVVRVLNTVAAIIVSGFAALFIYAAATGHYPSYTARELAVTAVVYVFCAGLTIRFVVHAFRLPKPDQTKKDNDHG